MTHGLYILASRRGTDPGPPRAGIRRITHQEEPDMTTTTKKRLPALLAAAAIAALGWGIAAPASAALVENGIEINGIEINGIEINGSQINGIELNGIEVNGIEVNGTQLKGYYSGPRHLGTGQGEPARHDGFDFGTTAVLGLE